MLLRAGLPVDFWWDAYETSNYITNRLPTKTAFGYQTQFEGVYGKIPYLSVLRVWGAKHTQELFAKRLAGEMYFWLSYGLFY